MTQRVTAAGLHIPPELLARLGWHEGQAVEVHVGENGLTITPASELERAILRRAVGYLIEHVGDATTIGPPNRCGDGWEVPVVLSYSDRQIGSLRFSANGDLLPDTSTPPEVMSEAAEQAIRA
jgi:antitoxin component of MazEF toxin-antitoxin module